MLQAKPGIQSEKGIRSLIPGSIGNWRQALEKQLQSHEAKLGLEMYS
jgi:hypothetical protein